MPRIQPISAISYACQAGGDISRWIAPPYDVLDATSKAALLAGDPHNIVAVDLPHLPPKTVGPDEVYEAAAVRFGDWLNRGILQRRRTPALFAYRQMFQVNDRQIQRLGLIANVALGPFGAMPEDAPEGIGGVFPHEQTFSAPKEDRLKLMAATRAQLSPIFGFWSDHNGAAKQLLGLQIEQAGPNFVGTTDSDEVRHEVWVIEDPRTIGQFAELLGGADTFIADGHHRYTTALNYRQHLIDQQGPLAPDHPANFCLFVLVAIEDPGMIVLPTHRVLGAMPGFSLEKFGAHSKGRLHITRFDGTDLQTLEKALPKAGPHAIGLYDSAARSHPLAVATTVELDPLAPTYPQRSATWRQLDVAIVQHLIVEEICQPRFCRPGQKVTWRFPHTLEALKADTDSDGYELGLILQPVSLESVRQVSEAGELMPQKSTFFYPKLATGLVIHPLE